MDPLSEIRGISQEQELQQLYKHIPLYSDIPNAGMKRDRENARLTYDPTRVLDENVKLLHLAETLKKGEIDEIVEGFAMNMGELEPRTLSEAFVGTNSNEWRNACKAEFDAIHQTGTFEPISDDARKKMNEGNISVHGTRPVLKVKLDENGNIARYKVRLVIQGFSMRKGVDYDNSFAPCARIASVRLLCALAVKNKWKILHGDVPNAYLNGKAQKLILVKLPQFWNEFMGTNLGKDGDAVICAKSLYGAPDAGRNWNTCQHDVFIANGYQQSLKEPCIYWKKKRKWHLHIRNLGR